MMSGTTASPLRPYIYNALPKGDALRYLTLHPGNDGDALECSLHATLIDGAPHYEAISYVWGTDDLDHPVICDGKVLLITPNLSKVLQRLRLRDASRTLWADSICINQKDLKEKGSQVAIMSKIYQHAMCVLMYMGEDHEGHGLHVQTLLEDVTRMVEDELEKIHPPTWDSFPYHEDVPFVDDMRWRSLSALLEQEWFDRGWVVREAALAQQGWVIWGQSEFDWTQLMLTLTWLEARGWKIEAQSGDVTSLAQTHLDAYVDRYIGKVQCFMERLDWKRNSVLDYLTAGRRLRMSDPRDRLYAFLDMSTEKERQIKVDPNYGDGILQVYHNFASQYICVTKGLRILDHVVHDTRSLQSGIPTWVPDWGYRESEPLRFEIYSELTSRIGAVYKPTLVEESVLKVRGVILGPALFTSSVFDGPTTTMETLAKLWTAVRSCKSASPYHGSYSMRAFLSTLTEDRRIGDTSIWAQQKTHYLKGLEDACDSAERRTHENSNIGTSIVDACIKKRVDGKKFMLTERGYMGLSPAIVQEGDMCGIIFGCTMPCMLRKTSQENQFKFLGLCFVLSNRTYETWDGYKEHGWVLGSEFCKEWVDWDVEEQDIYLC